MILGLGEERSSFLGRPVMCCDSSERGVHSLFGFEDTISLLASEDNVPTHLAAGLTWSA
jgi:hypothetical protein